MERWHTWHRIPRYLIFVIYCCGISLFFFCAFYAYISNYSDDYRPQDYPSFAFSDKLSKVPKSSEISTTVKPKSPKPKDILQIDEIPSIVSNNESLVSELSKVEVNLEVSKKDNKLQHQSGNVDSQSRNDAPLQKGETTKNSLSQTSTTEVPDSPCTSTVLKPKLILLWTPFFGYWEYMKNECFLRCRTCTNCRATHNRSLLLQSDAVVFHARDMNLNDLPAQRLPNQKWIFYCLESPPYSNFPGLQFMYKMFNWTMTYREDSDVVTRYGSIERVYPSKKLDLNELRGMWESKTRTVAWMTSHCPTHGGRDDYVQQLKKYIDVDIYGTCGELQCPKDSTVDCLRRFERKYKFFLAFENTVCKDYMTEKFFRTLQYNMIPVVFGGARYQKYSPPGSYIDALGFKSPKHLAYFLAGVGNDFSLYSTYFEWRKDYALKQDKKECALCSALHRDTGKSTIYEDMSSWWVRDGQCRTWKPKR